MKAPLQPAPDVRVYLFTYRRNHLLPRALDSLLRQTHTNWVCELHNDEPGDPFPRQLAQQINDPRIAYVHHDRNLGPTETFNRAFHPVAEPFVSLLEDDNWWEPECLARLLSAMSTHPQVHVAWVNMRTWQETEGGGWERQGTMWPEDSGQEVMLFEVPDPRQACGPIHSNGAMLVRVSAATMFQVPRSLPFFAIEPARERGYPGPLLLLTSPLANFAITRESWRDETADENMQVLVLLAQTLIAGSNLADAFYRQMWRACGGALGHKHRALIVAGFLAGRLSRVLKNARLADLAIVAGWALRHPVRFAKLFQARAAFPEVFTFLDGASSGGLAGSVASTVSVHRP